MTYSETIQYLYSRLPMFSRIGDAAIKKDLTNTRQLCKWLGQPQQQFPSLHIAGTNGKGSTSHMLAAAFQASVVEVLADRVSAAMQIFRTQFGKENSVCNLVVAGGVAANSAIRQTLEKLSEREDFRLSMPPIPLCTDNGAMVAWAGLERFALGLTDDLSVAPVARWPMEDLAKSTETELGRRLVPAGQGDGQCCAK